MMYRTPHLRTVHLLNPTTRIIRRMSQLINTDAAARTHPDPVARSPQSVLSPEETPPPARPSSSLDATHALAANFCPSRRRSKDAPPPSGRPAPRRRSPGRPRVKHRLRRRPPRARPSERRRPACRLCSPGRFLSPRLLIASRRLQASASEGSARDASTSFIHPAAVVHPDAAIGQGVSIGPFCTVGASARIGDACQLHTGSHVIGHTELGEGCVVHTGAILGADLPGRTIIGENNVIGNHAVVGVKCQDLKYKPGDECFLHIGNNNEIREYCSIHRSSKSCDCTVIGDKNLIMGSCHVAHDCKIGSNNIFANNTLFGGHVIVEVVDKENRKREAGEMGDAMRAQEKRAMYSKQDMDVLAALEEMW